MDSNFNSTLSLWQKSLGLYNHVFTDLADPRVEHMFLMQGPLPITAICLSYIYIVLSLGPRLMRDRKPYELKKVLVVYNAAQTIFSAVHFCLGLEYWIRHYGWGLRCLKLDPATETADHFYYGIRICHVYFLSKISELCDTFFFVLKKKDKHVSLLHVFHHAVMPFSVWFGVKFHPGGNLAFFGLPNLFVHIWMYLYYMMAALGPQYQKYIWWKKHITEMQLAQFGLVMLYMLYISYACQLPRHFVIWIFCLDVAFVVLFVDFYWKAYKKGAARDKKKAEKVNGYSQLQNGHGEKVNGLSETKNGYTKFTNGNGVCESQYDSNGYIKEVNGNIELKKEK